MKTQIDKPVKLRSASVNQGYNVIFVRENEGNPQSQYNTKAYRAFKC